MLDGTRIGNVGRYINHSCNVRALSFRFWRPPKARFGIHNSCCSLTLRASPVWLCTSAEQGAGERVLFRRHDCSELRFGCS